MRWENGELNRGRMLKHIILRAKDIRDAERPIIQRNHQKRFPLERGRGAYPA